MGEKVAPHDYEQDPKNPGSLCKKCNQPVASMVHWQARMAMRGTAAPTKRG